VQGDKGVVDELGGDPHEPTFAHHLHTQENMKAKLSVRKFLSPSLPPIPLSLPSPSLPLPISISRRGYAAHGRSVADSSTYLSILHKVDIIHACAYRSIFVAQAVRYLLLLTADKGHVNEEESHHKRPEHKLERKYRNGDESFRKQ
tara:strand:- start:893 stop:1330 length:438 start_codon:yes stop_codon:yes gene_type:complete